MSNGIVFYEGPSQLNSEQIIGIATKNSKNIKTGAMIQCWIMPSDENPIESHKTGSDVSVCGDCKLREKICYVNLAQAPLSIYKSWKRGNYPVNIDYSFFKNKKVRFGAWGDPTAIPIEIWHEILAVAKGWTSYTHQWKNPQFAWYKEFTMASCDSEEESKLAKKNGWRTFRVKNSKDKIYPDEVSCPAALESNYKSTCAKCLLCAGTSKLAKNIVINSHGLSHKIKKFEDMRMANPSKGVNDV